MHGIAPTIKVHTPRTQTDGGASGLLRWNIESRYVLAFSAEAMFTTSSLPAVVVVMMVRVVPRVRIVPGVRRVARVRTVVRVAGPIDRSVVRAAVGIAPVRIADVDVNAATTDMDTAGTDANVSRRGGIGGAGHQSQSGDSRQQNAFHTFPLVVGCVKYTGRVPLRHHTMAAWHQVSHEQLL